MFGKIQEWIYRKRMITPLPPLEALAHADYLLCPQFRLVTSKNNKKQVLLIDNATYVKDFSNINIDSCTEHEAMENHVHLFDNVGKRNRSNVIKIGTAIAKNLLNALVQTFPERKFVVFLEVKVHDSTIIRFHQILDDEPPYFDIAATYPDDLELFEFRN